MPADPHTHALFQKYPHSGTENISTGQVPVPYHVYRGRCLLIGGTVDLRASQHLLETEDVAPVATHGGRGLMGIWVCDFQDASLGPHQELQFSILVSREPEILVPDHPFAGLQALALNPNVAMLAHSIWNDQSDAMAYNQELLGLNANLAEGKITQDPTGQRLDFHFSNAASRAWLLQGRVKTAPRTPLNAAWSLMRLFGFRGMREFSSQPWLNARVINPKGPIIPRNATAQTFTKNEREILQFWDPTSDRIQLHSAQYQTLGFQPSFVEHMLGFKFVYLPPK
jgi:hypothetical protein